jgi:hypothetical protein
MVSWLKGIATGDNAVVRMRVFEWQQPVLGGWIVVRNREGSSVGCGVGAAAN